MINYVNGLRASKMTMLYNTAAVVNVSLFIFEDNFNKAIQDLICTTFFPLKVKISLDRGNNFYSSCLLVKGNAFKQL